MRAARLDPRVRRKVAPGTPAQTRAHGPQWACTTFVVFEAPLLAVFDRFAGSWS